MPTANKKYNLPKGYSLFKTVVNTKEFLASPIQFITKSMANFGDTYTATLGTQKVIVTQDPDFINYVLRENHKNYEKSEVTAKRGVQFFGNGLLFSNGAYWLKQRRLIQPAFHRMKLQGLYENIIRIVQEFVADFPSGEQVDIYPIAHELSFKILLQSLFDVELSPSIQNEIKDIFGDLSQFLMQDINQPFKKILYPITGEERLNLNKAKRLRAIILEIINERKASEKEYNDILDMMIYSTYEDTGKRMTEEQVVDEVQIFINAGHETTGNTIAWLLSVLAANPNSQQQLVASLQEGSVHDSINNDFLRATINESMRLHATSWTTERVTIEDDQFGEFSYPKGTIIATFFFGAHRNEKHWESALEFKPERFIEDPKLSKSKKFYPFGAGPRMCIGNHFALAEISFFLHTFFKEWEITTTAQVPEPLALITLRPDKVVLNIKKRTIC